MLITQMMYTSYMMFFTLYVFNFSSSQSLNHIMSEYYINLKYHIKKITNAIHNDEYKFASIAAQTCKVSVQTLQK